VTDINQNYIRPTTFCKIPGDSDLIPSGFQGTLPILWVFNSSVSVTRKIRFGTANVPGFLQVIKIRHFSQCVTNIFTFTWWEQISVGLEHPPISHEQEGVVEGEEGVQNSDCGVRTKITKGEERISQGKSVSEQCRRLSVVINNFISPISYQMAVLW